MYTMSDCFANLSVSQKNDQITIKGQYSNSYPYYPREVFHKLCDIQPDSIYAQKSFEGEDFSLEYSYVRGYNPIKDFSGLIVKEEFQLQMIQSNENPNSYSFYYSGDLANAERILDIMRLKLN